MKKKLKHQMRSNTVIGLGTDKKQIQPRQDNKNVFLIEDDASGTEEKFKRVNHRLYKSMYATKPKSFLMTPNIVQPPPSYNSGLCLLQKNFQTKHSLTQPSEKAWQTHHHLQKVNENKNINLSGKFKSMGVVTRNQLLDQQFEQQFQEISRMNRFKSTLGDVNQLKFLKPYLRNKKNKNIHSIKSALYKNIKTSVNYEMQFTQQTPSIYQYLTGFSNSELNCVSSQLKKKSNSNVLREKIKKYNSKSDYLKKMNKIKQEGQSKKNAKKLC